MHKEALVFNNIEEAIADLRLGKLIIVCDDANRENEGDLVGLAEFITPESVNFMITHGKGLLCVPMSSEYAQHFGLYDMVRRNNDSFGTAFTQSVDHISTTTGISAYERATTIKALSNLENNSLQFRAPGHIFPLIAQESGVLKRSGHTEAAVDLANLAGSKPVGVICEIIKSDGTMALLPDLLEMSQSLGLKIIHIQDLIHYRKTNEQLVERVACSNLPTKFGEFNLIGFRSIIDNQDVVVLSKGDISQNPCPVVRMHSECLTGDSFGSLRCECGEQLAKSLSFIEQNGGLLIYLRQEGRGIGLLNKIKAYNLQDQGMDTVEANLHLGFLDDMRDYYLAAQVLKDLGVSQIELMSNNPRKIGQLEQYGIHVKMRKEIIIDTNSENSNYMQVKKNKLGHLLD